MVGSKAKREPKAEQNVMEELKRNKADQYVLTIIQAGELLGFEEILGKLARRLNSIQVSSDTCQYLYLSAREFREKFYNHSIVMKNLLGDRVEERNQFHGEL